MTQEQQIKLEKIDNSIIDNILHILENENIRTIKKISLKEFILKEDLSEHLSDIDNDDILDHILDECEYSKSIKDKLTTYVINNVYFDLFDIKNILDNLSDTDLNNILVKYYKINIPINTLQDVMKLDLLIKLNDKYSLLELEEKIKNIL